MPLPLLITVIAIATVLCGLVVWLLVRELSGSFRGSTPTRPAPAMENPMRSWLVKTEDLKITANNPFTSPRDSDHVQWKGSLHWGIFILPTFIGVLVTLVEGIPILYGIALLKQLTQGLPSPNSIWLIPLIITLPFVAASWLPFVGAWMAYSNAELALTDQHLICQQGRFFRSWAELPLTQIGAITIVQSPIGQALDYGTVRVTSSVDAVFCIGPIENPQGFHRRLRLAIDAARAPKTP